MSEEKKKTLLISNFTHNLPDNMDDLMVEKLKLKGYIHKIEFSEEDHEIEIEVSGNWSMTKTGVTFKDTVTKEEIYYTDKEYKEQVEKNKQSEERHKQLEERNRQLKIRNRQLKRINKFIEAIHDEDPDEPFFDKLM